MVIVYPAVIHEDTDGLWAEFPDLIGCQPQGDTLEEILTNASEALECCALGIMESGGKLPSPARPSRIKADADLAKNTRSVKKRSLSSHG